MKTNRVLLKLSGEALAGPKKTGFDEDTVREVARQVKISVDQGVQVGIVIGGGNFWRGRTSSAIDRTKADQIGMLATVMNCIYVSEIFRAEGMKTQIFTPFLCGSMTELFSKDKANRCFEEGTVVFFAGGTGHPYFSTDTGIVLRAIEMDADCILLAKRPQAEPRCQALRHYFHPGSDRQKACGGGPDGLHHVYGAQDAHGGVRLKREGQHRQRHDRKNKRHDGDRITRRIYGQGKITDL